MVTMLSSTPKCTRVSRHNFIAYATIYAMRMMIMKMMMKMIIE